MDAECVRVPLGERVEGIVGLPFRSLLNTVRKILIFFLFSLFGLDFKVCVFYLR